MSTTEQRISCGPRTIPEAEIYAALARSAQAAVQALSREQLDEGGAPCLETISRGQERLLTPRPYLSALTYRCLDFFDPSSIWGEASSFSWLREPLRNHLIAEVARIRWNLRQSLARQRGPGTGWRLYGRAGLAEIDPGTTAAATLVLVGSRPGAPHRPLDRELLSLLREFARPFEMGSQKPPDWIAAAEITGALTICDRRNLLLESRLRNHLEKSGTIQPSPLSLPEIQTVTNLWRKAALPGLDAIAEWLIPELLSRQDESGRFGTPHETALALNSLLDLGDSGPHLARAAIALLRDQKQSGLWLSEVNSPGDPVSSMLTCALCFSAIARGTHIVDWGEI